MKKHLLIFASFIFVILFIPLEILAVYFAENNILLYENGKRIFSSNVIHDRDMQSPVCEKGICFVGQQYENVTFYVTKQNNILSYGAWINDWYKTHKGCEGYAIKEKELSEALEEWRRSTEFLATQRKVEEASDKDTRLRLWDELEPAKKEFLKKKGFDFIDNPTCSEINFSDYQNVYLKNIENNSVYSVSLNMPPPEGGEGCGSPGCIGGRIGNNRTLVVDLQKKTVIQTENPLIKSNVTINLFWKYITCYIKGLFKISC